MERLNFEECKNCKNWDGSITKCFNECVIPLDALEQFNRYKRLEEQGILLKLPCAVGDTVYYLYTNENKESEITEMKVGCIEPFGAIRQRKGICEVWNVYAEADYTKAYFKFLDFGKTVFITKEEAEAASKELSSKE